MVKCCRYCNFPELSVEASQHRCPICGIQFHGICSDFLHPNAEEMRLTMGNDILCPCCARLFSGVDHPITTPASAISSSDEDSTSSNSNSILTADSPPILSSPAKKKGKQKQHPNHALPPNVKVISKQAADGTKRHFKNQSKCCYTDSSIVIWANPKCEKSVHVQCFLNLIRGGKEGKVSFIIFNFYFYF